MLVGETASIKKFINKRADPGLIMELEKARRAGDEETYNQIKEELLNEYMKFERIY